MSFVAFMYVRAMNAHLDPYGLKSYDTISYGHGE